LILNGTHLDVIQMNNSDNNTSGSMERRDMDMSNNASQQKQQQQNSIVITATNIVPEFPLVLPIAAAAIATAIMIARKIKTIQCSLF
jgi:Na+(H+)/acetate symporter ActP